jgi:4'-phosphopantetheinyl transferase
MFVDSELVAAARADDLEAGNIHVWRAELNVNAANLDRFREFLDVEELARARRFRFEPDRGHFIAAHGILRAILGHYLDAEPCGLRFRTNAYGKPALIGGSDRPAPSFNMSHSSGLALYAFSRGREVGIDLERISPEFPYRQIAESFFSQSEQQTFGSLPVGKQVEAFFICWTRKEAYLKATGRGLSVPLDGAECSVGIDEPVLNLRGCRGPGPLSMWSFRQLIPADGYTAALAVEGSGWQLRCFRWPDQATG